MKNKNGYTLIEILIAMGILAIMAIPILDMYSNSLKFNIMADNQIQSDMIAQKHMEFYKSNPLPADASSTTTDEGFDVLIEYTQLPTDLTKDNSSISNVNVGSSPDETFEMFLNDSSKIVFKNTAISNNNLNVANYNYGLYIENATDTNNFDMSYEYIDGVTLNKNKLLMSTKMVASNNPIILSLSQNQNLAPVASSTVNIDVYNNSDRKVEVLLNNEVLKDVKIRIGENSNEVKIYRNLTTNIGSTTNNLISYEINITVSKAGTVYTNLRSVIDK